MAYTGLLNPSQAAAAHLGQAGYDPLQQEAILAGISGYGVSSGCVATGSGTMQVAVTSGVVSNNAGATQNVTSGNVTIGAADPTYDRIDLVVAAYSNGAKSVLAGANAVPPDASHPGPSWPSSFDATVYAVLAEVYVAAGVTAIASIDVIDKRVFPTGLYTEIAARAAADALLIPLTQKGANNGVASLDSGGKVPSGQLPTAAVTSVDGLTGAVTLPGDGAAGTATKRSLGTGATQAAAGNDSRLSDTRTPTDGSVTNAKLAANATVLTGTLAGRPAANTVVAGTLYFATDVRGGTLYRSDGSTWSIATPGVTEIAGTDFAPTGLTGAIALTRYVGGTASGAPTSGTFAVGDWVVDQTGHFFVCTAAGTPGSWVDVVRGTELGYAENGVTQTTTSTTPTDISGVTTGSIAIGTRPVTIEFNCAFWTHSVSAGRCAVAIMEDSSYIGGLGLAGHATAGKSVQGLVRRLRRAPSVGNHTYKAQFWVVDAGTLTLSAGVTAGVEYGPISISVTER